MLKAKISKSSYCVFLVMASFLIPFQGTVAQKIDPYHRSTGGFGYLLSATENISAWWAEGAYKIMNDTPVPEKKRASIEIFAATNEYEPFQVVLRSETAANDLKIHVTDLIGNTDTICSSYIEMRKVEYVEITEPTDSYGFAGLWPDPLPFADSVTSITPGINTVFWISVYVPPGTMKGSYKGSVILTTSDWEINIPLKINIWDFELPSSPSIRSGFGLSVDKIIAYHNLTERDDIVETFDLYMKAFRNYRIAPYYFYAPYPIMDSLSGVFWKGGYYDSEMANRGRYALKIDDNSRTEAAKAVYQELIPAEPGIEYRLSWTSRSAENNQQYCILIESIDGQGSIMEFGNRMDCFETDTVWKNQTFRLGKFSDKVIYLKLTLFPAFRTAEGDFTGTVWFDNIKLTKTGNDVNLLKQGDFEVDVDKIDISLDFSDFDNAAARYLDDFGFNSFRLDLKGMGGGTYYSRNEGQFGGFVQGTEEYNKLMDRYLGQIEEHLKQNGWLGKEYIYWFDEPGKADYPFVRNGMEIIKRGAPEIKTFLTENDPGPDIMDVTDITCTIWHRIDLSKAKEVNSRGQEYWSYLCTAPKSPWVSEFIDHDAINLRIWLWMSYSYGLDGILIWSTNYWTSRAGSLPSYLQNPWKEAASYVQGYGWPLGKQTNWGNGDGRLWYPPNRNPNSNSDKFVEGPVPSIRIEFLRQGIEDFEYFKILENLVESKAEDTSAIVKRGRNLLKIPTTIFTDGRKYTKNPQDLLKYRKEVAETIEKLQTLKY